MNSANKNGLRLSVLDIEFSQDSQNKKPSFECCISLNDMEFDKFDSKNEHQAQIPLIDGTDTFRVTLIDKETGELVGCISFLSQMFFPFKGQAFTQWITLFDTPEDDEFDGDIGVDDEEAPRALFTFTIESSGHSYIHEDSKYGAAFIGSEQKDLPKNQNLVEGSQLLGPNGHDISLGANERSSQTIIDHSVGKISKIEKDETGNQYYVSNLMNPFSQFNSQNISEDHHIGAREGSKESSQYTSVKKEAKDENPNIELEERISDLINVLASQANGDKIWQQNLQSNNLQKETEKDYLLQLEIEKNKMLEITLRQAEMQIAKTQQLYQELEQKSKVQLQQIIEESRRYNKENYDLKKRINELESQTISGSSELSSSPGKMGSRPNEEFEKTKRALQEQRDLVFRLQAQLKSFEINSQSIENKQWNKEKYEQEIKSLRNEKISLENLINSLETKYESIEIKNQSLEAELKISQSEIKRLNQQIEDYKNLGFNFRKSLDDLSSQKNKEISTLKEHLTKYEHQIKDLQRENITNKQETTSNTDLEERIRFLESSLSQREDETRKLQNYIQTLENKALSPVKISKNLDSQSYKEIDSLKFEIRDLRLVLNETEDIKQTNQILKAQIKVFQEENDQLRENIANIRKRLYSTASELIKQTSITLEQNNIITNLNQQMQILDESLKKAFHNIAKLQANIESQKKEEIKRDTYTQSPNKNEIDNRLSDFLSQHMIPIKFIKMSEGLYIFGSRQLRLQAMNNRLTVRFRDGYMNLEEFIRLYAHQELLKVKMPKTDNYYINMEQEEIPHEAKSNQVLWDINENQRSPQKMSRTEVSPSRNSTQVLGRLLNSDKKEPKYIKPRETNESAQISYDDNNEYIIFDITPQGNKDQGLTGKPKKNIKYPLADRKTDSSQLFTNSLRSYESESKRNNSTRSHDSFKSNTRLNLKK